MQVYSLFVLSSISSLIIAAPTPPDAPRSPDHCDPQIQQPTDPKDTCATGPSSSSNTTGFTIGGLDDGFMFARFDWTICNQLIDTICNTMADNNKANGTWYFETSQVHLDYGDPACQMGFYLPADPLAALKPSPKQCMNIFGNLVNGAEFSGWKWQGATINLKVNPATAQGQWALPGGSGTGEAENAGYPSYVLQVQKNNGPDTVCC